MDPVAQSAMQAIADFGLRAEAVRTLKKYAVGRLPDERLSLLCSKVLANDAIEQVIVGPLSFERLQVGSPYEFRLVTVPIRAMDDAALERLSREGQLYLSLVEMQTIQAHFRTLDRDPTDVELETDRPDVERALQPQDAGRADPLPRSQRRAPFPEHAQGDDLRRHAENSQAGRRARLVRERVFRQRRRDPLRRPVQRRLQGRDAQPSLGLGALRRGQHGHRRRDPRPDGHRHGRQADLQHRRLLLRPARHARPNRSRPACSIRAA